MNLGIKHIKIGGSCHGMRRNNQKYKSSNFLQPLPKRATLKWLVGSGKVDLVNYGVLPNIGEYPATLLPLSIEGERQSNIFIAQSGDIACIGFCICPRR